MKKKIVFEDGDEAVIAYALLEISVGGLFVASRGEKIVYASFVEQDADLGLVGSFCVANNQMEQGVAGLKQFLEAIKAQRYLLKPDYAAVLKLVDASIASDAPAAFFELNGTEFQKQVWRVLIKVGKGEVVTYARLAEMVGRPKAVRAVANAVAANNIAHLIPCHRIVRSDGSCGGYRWGEQMKKRLIASEVVN